MCLPVRYSFRLVVLVSLITAGSLVQAAESDDELYQGAAERIEQHRKSDAVITVVDAQGEPVSDVEVTVQQTRHAFLFGCNFFQCGKFQSDADEQAYRTQFAGVFNFATLGFYWASYERVQDQPIYEYSEMVARWCRDNDIAVKGHPLMWNHADPRWLPDDLTQVKQLQLQRITDCVKRFDGLIDIWDVVNEATHFERDEFRRRSPKLTGMWDQVGRVEFVDQCFRAARAANPDATLLINDYRTDAKYAQVIDEMEKNEGKLACDTIGIQSHMHSGTWNNRKIWEVCERFSRFGLPLNFTELTVLSGAPKREHPSPWDSTPEGEKEQAEHVRRIYTMLFSHPVVTAITWWDFSDRNAWQSAPAGLIGKDLEPKPAYKVLQELIKDQWWTQSGNHR